MQMMTIPITAENTDAAGMLAVANELIAEQTRLIAIQHSALIGMVHKFGHVQLCNETRVALQVIALAEGRSL